MELWRRIWSDQKISIIVALALFLIATVIRTLSNIIDVSVKDAADVITATITVVGVYVAWSGLNTWKKQVRGTKEFDIAYKLNYSVLRLRESIQSVRNPAIWPSEDKEASKFGKERYPELNEEEIKKNSRSLVYEKRWQEISKTMTKVEANLLAAEVLWGRDVIELIKPIKQKMTDLNIALSQNFNPNLKTLSSQEIYSAMYADLNDPPTDKFSIELNEHTQKVTDYLKPKTRS